MNKNLILFILMVISMPMLAQQISPYVISSSGGNYQNTEGMLSFTTGELAVVETYISPAIILTQGFQQPWDFGTFITEHPSPNFSFGIYPNPSDGNFNLLTETEDNEMILVTILDVLGKEIMRTTFYHQNKINVEPFDLSFAAQGIYLITITVKESNTSQESHFIKKLQIVK